MPGSTCEPQHDKTNKMTCRSPNGDSDQPGYPPSLIRVFAVRMKKYWVLKRTANTLIRQGGCPGSSESSQGTHAMLLVLLFCGSCNLAVNLMFSRMAFLLQIQYPIARICLKWCKGSCRKAMDVTLLITIYRNLRKPII